MTGGPARLFVAVDLPEGPRARLAAWGAAAAAADDALRPIPADNLHVTLCFLGSRGEEEIAGIGRVVAACAAPVSELHAARGVWLPRSRPRVLAVDLEDPAGRLAALQQRVSRALMREAGYVLQPRRFRPHVSVARVRSAGHLRRPASPREPPAGLRFLPPALTLYRSILGRAGARYEPLARTALVPV